MSLKELFKSADWKWIRKWSAISTVGLGISLFGGYFIYDKGDEFFLAGESEERLEEKMNLPIYLNWSDGITQRTERVAALNQAFTALESNWDNLDLQLRLINWIRIEDQVIEEGENITVARYLREYNGIIVFCSPDNTCMNDSDFSHELGHAVHDSLPPEFTEEWLMISGRHYHQLSSLESPAFLESGCFEYMNSVAAVSCYGAKNIMEDVATTVELVYLLNSPDYLIDGFPERGAPFRRSSEDYVWLKLNIIPETIPRIIQKVELLYEYEAFSERERNFAIRQLKSFGYEECTPEDEHFIRIDYY